MASSRRLVKSLVEKHHMSRKGNEASFDDDIGEEIDALIGSLEYVAGLAPRNRPPTEQERKLVDSIRGEINELYELFDSPRAVR